MIQEMLLQTIQEFVKFAPILVGAIIISQIINIYFEHHKIKKKLNPSEKNIAEATVAGILTPGPMIAYLPIIAKLKKQGLPTCLIAAFITGQTLIGPGRIVMEVGYFGAAFFMVRLLLALIIGVCVGTGFRIINIITGKHKKNKTT